MMIRTALLSVAVATLLMVASGCYVHASVNSRGGGHYRSAPSYHRPAPRAHGWVYYPEYDIYYSSGAGHWCYYDGGRWVVVTSRPTWFSASSRTTTIRLDYSGSRPFEHWHSHHSRWGVRYRSSSGHPRAWGRTVHRGGHSHERRTYRYSERRNY